MEDRLYASIMDQRLTALSSLTGLSPSKELINAIQEVHNVSQGLTLPYLAKKDKMKHGVSSGISKEEAAKFRELIAKAKQKVK